MYADHVRLILRPAPSLYRASTDALIATCEYSIAVRIAAAVYEVMGPTLEEIRNDIKTVKSDILTIKGEIASLSQQIGNITEENSSVESVHSDLTWLDARLSSLNQLVSDDFNEIKTKLADVGNSTNDMKENLTVQISGYTCGGTGGWRRAVHLDMTDPNTNCPSGWNTTGFVDRTGTPRRACGKANTRYMSCDSAFFPVSGGPYNHVCGRIKAYQSGVPQAFFSYYDFYDEVHTSDPYFSGVAVMHGNPRQHIWTFAAGGQENVSSNSNNCPCDTMYASYIYIPQFVDNDYFCESGYVYPGYWDREKQSQLHFNDTLWDGKDCHPNSNCCSLHNPPFFTKNLNLTTADDLELRMCLLDSVRYANITVELVELYVKEDHVQTTLKQMDDHLKESFSHQTNNINNLHVHTCGGTHDWRRAVYLDMKDHNTNCPSGWNMTGYSKRTCGRANNRGWTCSSAFFPVGGGPYNQVCGRIQGYQFGLPGYFAGYNANGIDMIDDAFFDGVAVMHGNPRQHIWTFAMGAEENGTLRNNCPCDTGHDPNYSSPPFVGDDYFCEAGHVSYTRGITGSYEFHSNDTLWDGKDCHSTSTCCSFHNPPYFNKPLNDSTTDDLELRICFNNGDDVNVAVELVELYVQ